MYPSVLSLAFMTARKALSFSSLMSPTARPDRSHSPVGRFDHFCFCAVSPRSNMTLLFSSSVNVPRTVFADDTIDAVAGVSLAAELLVHDPVDEALEELDEEDNDVVEPLLHPAIASSITSTAGADIAR